MTAYGEQRLSDRIGLQTKTSRLRAIRIRSRLAWIGEGHDRLLLLYDVVMLRIPDRMRNIQSHIDLLSLVVLDGRLPSRLREPQAARRATINQVVAVGSETHKHEIVADGVTSKRRVTKAGATIGGAPFSRGALFHLLSNRLYLGEIVHKDKTYQGEHSGIVDREMFDKVQRLLAENAGPARRANVGLAALPLAAPLVGRVFDDRGNLMSPVNARKPGGQTYRYYVSGAALQGRKQEAGSLPRFPGRCWRICSGID